MALTLSDLKAQIADDLERSDLTAQIAEAIGDAVRTHENERFWFNETVNSTVTLSASAFSISLTALPLTFLHIDRIRLLQDSTSLIDLDQRTYGRVMFFQDARTFAEPSEWALYAETIQFDTAPNVNETLVLDGIIRTSTASAAADTATWFSDPLARQLIRNKAKLSLYANLLKDSEQAGICKGMADEALRQMRVKSTTRRATGYVVPSYF